MQSLYFEVCLPIKQELVLLCAFKIMVPQSIYEMIRLKFFFLKILNVLNVLKVSSSTLSVNITPRYLSLQILCFYACSIPSYFSFVILCTFPNIYIWKFGDFVKKSALALHNAGLNLLSYGLCLVYTVLLPV